MADLETLYDDTPILADVFTNAPGAEGSLPLTEDMLLNAPSGDLFALSQNVGMGWDPAEIGRTQVLILSTQGGIRADDGTPIALGYHTGHWEVGLLMQAAAKELRGRDSMPFAGYVTDPCDGRSQGTEGMLETRMAGARIDQVRQPELSHVAQSLERRRVHEPERERIHPDVLPERIPDDLVGHGTDR